ALVEAASHPELADLALYLQLRVAAAANDAEAAGAAARSLAERHPESIWIGRARLDVARVWRRLGNRERALEWLALETEASPGSDRVADVTALQRAELEHDAGRDDTALALAAALRDGKPRGLIAPRARRLVERIRERPGREPSPTERLAEADLRL